MNKQAKKSLYTFVVQAEKISKGNNLIPLKPHYFRDYDAAIVFLEHYINVIKRDSLVICASLSSQYSVATAIPELALWHR
jgi:hypothetical protein